jgi:RNA polymerase sigma-70 factor (ECF subfamily)
MHTSLNDIYVQESRAVFSTLVRLLGDFNRAEEAMHEAFTAALQTWPTEGVPKNPRAWLVSTGRFKAIDALRRQSRQQAALPELARQQNTQTQEYDDEHVEDDQLRLIFTCCHPALAPETQVALTLREVCGLSTEAIASAFLLQPSAIAQRIVRGKSKIRDAKIPYIIPTKADLPERIEVVLSVIYLVFNEGYSASSGTELLRTDLAQEAIRLCRLLAELLPDTEVLGLLSLMLLQHSRRKARMNANGDMILLEDQDRSLWDQTAISEGRQLLQQLFTTGQLGPFALQAAIAAVHAEAKSAADTNWDRMVGWYDLLLEAQPSPIVTLNRAVALAMRDGPEAGLQVIDELLGEGELDKYSLAHAAKAEFCRRLGRRNEAKKAYETALSLTQQAPQQRFLQERLKELA